MDAAPLGTIAHGAYAAIAMNAAFRSSSIVRADKTIRIRVVYRENSSGANVRHGGPPSSEIRA